MVMAFAVEGIVAVGMTILLISGSIDLSDGSVTALAMVMAGALFLVCGGRSARCGAGRIQPSEARYRAVAAACLRRAWSLGAQLFFAGAGAGAAQRQDRPAAGIPGR